MPGGKDGILEFMIDAGQNAMRRQMIGVNREGPVNQRMASVVRPLRKAIMPIS